MPRDPWKKVKKRPSETRKRRILDALTGGKPVSFEEAARREGYTEEQIRVARRKKWGSPE